MSKNETMKLSKRLEVFKLHIYCIKCESLNQLQNKKLGFPNRLVLFYLRIEFNVKLRTARLLTYRLTARGFPKKFPSNMRAA